MGVCVEKINMPDYLRSSENKAADRKVKEVLTSKFIMNSTKCFGAKAFWRVHSVCRLKIAVNHMICPPRKMAYALQEPLKEELVRLQRQQIIVPIGEDEISEWYNRFMLVPKANGKVRLCLDPSRLNK